MPTTFLEQVAFFAAIILPLWNFPLIVRIIKRRSSEDLSLWWVIGVWTCLVLMVPAGLRSVDIVWKTFTITNTLLFSVVTVVAVRYRKKREYQSENS